MGASGGGLAQMVERTLSMREVAGSMPASSINISYATIWKFLKHLQKSQCKQHKWNMKIPP